MSVKTRLDTLEKETGKREPDVWTSEVVHDEETDRSTLYGLRNGKVMYSIRFGPGLDLRLL
jgi:hypothetical protein